MDIRQAASFVWIDEAMNLESRGREPENLTIALSCGSRNYAKSLRIE
jgi:hypothetical protein